MQQSSGLISKSDLPQFLEHSVTSVAEDLKQVSGHSLLLHPFGTLGLRVAHCLTLVNNTVSQDTLLKH